MKEKLIHLYIQEYIDNFREISTQEIYKWRAVKQFQDNWFKDFGHFQHKLETVLSETGNLLESGKYFPRRMIIENAEKTPALIESLFEELYDEDVDLSSRIIGFKKRMDVICEDNYPGKKHYQDHRAIIVYLALRFPETYYLYKFTMFKEFVDKIGYHYRPIGGRIENIHHFMYLCEGLNEEIRSNDELLKLHYGRLNEELYTDSSFHILTQDFIYAVTNYFDEIEVNEHRDTKVIFRHSEIADYVNQHRGVVLGGRVIDFERLYKKNKRIGNDGEQWVFNQEVEKLRSWGRNDLAGKVKRVSVEQGDGLGYDILSFDEKGAELYIEVKTTKGGLGQSFYITMNELESSRRFEKKYRLYRVYNFDGESGDIEVFSGSLEAWCDSPSVFKVDLKRC